MGGMVWVVPPERAFVQGYAEYAQRLELAIHQLALRFSAEIETWMKVNAPWMDQTGNLRQSLYSTVKAVLGQMIVITFDYGLDYGVFLELAHQGRFAIIAPALDHFGPLFLAAMQRLVT